MILFCVLWLLLQKDISQRFGKRKNFTEKLKVFFHFYPPPTPVISSLLREAAGAWMRLVLEQRSQPGSTPGSSCGLASHGRCDPLVCGLPSLCSRVPFKKHLKANYTC